MCKDGIKEKHFYDDSNSLLGSPTYPDGRESYAKLFRHCPTSSLTIDSTPSYISVDNTSMMIAATYGSQLGSKKFILIIREPVARLFSEYRMRLRTCIIIKNKKNESTERTARSCAHVARGDWAAASTETRTLKTFTDWVNSPKGEKSLVRGFFKVNMKIWLSVIARQQMLVLSFDYLIKRTDDSMTRVQHFLGLENGWGDAPFPAQKKGGFVDKNAIMDCRVAKFLDAIYLEMNGNLTLFVSFESGPRPATEPAFPDFESPLINCMNEARKFYLAKDFLA